MTRHVNAVAVSLSSIFILFAWQSIRGGRSFPLFPPPQRLPPSCRYCGTSRRDKCEGKRHGLDFSKLLIVNSF